jgi:hypothetical protein
VDAAPAIGYLVGTDGGGRTHTLLRVLDFESSASANSATSATSITNYKFAGLRAYDLAVPSRQYRCKQYQRIFRERKRPVRSSAQWFSKAKPSLAGKLTTNQ